MKKSKLFAIGLASMAMIAPASAVTTTIRILGSNGDRAATQLALTHLLDASPAWNFRGNKGGASAAAPANALSSNFGVYNGSWNGNPVIIKVSFAGALAGVASVAGNLPGRFVVSDGTGSGAVNDPSTDSAVLNVDYESVVPDFGFSTNFQTTSPFQGTYTQGNTDGKYTVGTHTYVDLIEEKVGVSPLVFYASPGFPGTPNSNATFSATYNGPSSTGATGTYVPNITTQLAQSLYTNGSMRLSQFTGDAAHEKYTVFPLGRNTDAGQRFGVHTEIGLGTTQSVKVWQPTFSTAQSTTANSNPYGGVVGSHVPWPKGIANSQYLPVSEDGEGGYATGASLAPNLTATLSVTAARSNFNNFAPNAAIGGFYIGYVTPSDGNTYITSTDVPIASRGVALKYNGVPYTSDNVRNGAYTAWVYNRIIRRPGSLADPGNQDPVNTVRDFANALRDQILNTDAVAGGGILLDASFRANRLVDGGLVIPTF